MIDEDKSADGITVVDQTFESLTDDLRQFLDKWRVVGVSPQRAWAMLGTEILVMAKRGGGDLDDVFAMLRQAWETSP